MLRGQLRFSLPPPSITILGPVLFTIFAVAVSVIVTGSWPQLNVMTPPLATAATTASPVQLALVPEPTTVRGLELSSACASAGGVHVPSGFPAAGPSCGLVALPPPGSIEPSWLHPVTRHAPSAPHTKASN